MGVLRASRGTRHGGGREGVSILELLFAIVLLALALAGAYARCNARA